MWVLMTIAALYGTLTRRLSQESPRIHERTRLEPSNASSLSADDRAYSPNPHVAPCLLPLRLVPPIRANPPSSILTL
ncbi:hypothetical protein B0H13DRAFT_2383252 [Mycena leptocephala]|nr:hypothetical protein B0H13DRAFT_2383252 [Mycena leptocephala]